MKILYRIVIKSFYFYFKFIIGMKITSLCDFKSVLNSKCILAANHISNFDPPIVGGITPIAVHYLAKEELFKFKPFGKFLLMLNSIPLRRGILDRRALGKVNEILDKNESVVIFPEGSRKNFTARAGIGLVAMNTKTPIVPIYIENSNHIFKCFLRIKRLKVIIGNPIEVDYFKDWELNKNNYRQLAKYTLETINSLKSAVPMQG